MHNRTSKTLGQAMGIDLGDKRSHFCMLNARGQVISEGSFTTTQASFEKRFKGLAAIRVAIEVGTHSPWVSRLLKKLGHDVLVANARRLRLIYQSDRKNDRVDAENLARLVRVDPELLSPIQHRGPTTQRHLASLRARDTLVATRTKLINHVRGAVKSVGARLHRCSAECFHKRAAAEIPESLRLALSPLIEVIADLTVRIRRYDRAIVSLTQKDYPETKHLMQVKGVGPLTSVAFVLTLEDPARFRRSRHVGPYLGLQPRQDESGSISRQLGITKAGDPFVRRLLVGSAQYILGPFGPDTDLRRWGHKLAKRGGKNAKKRATVAVARKLAVLLHRLWSDGRPYEPLRLSERAEAVA